MNTSTDYRGRLGASSHAMLRTPGRSHVWIGLLGLILLATPLRLIMRRGFSDADSFAYVEAAVKLNELGSLGYLSELSNIYENRIAIVFPLALVFRLFGYSETSTALLPLLASLLAVVTAFLLGSLTNYRVGIIAALIVATLPLDVSLATAVLPDSIIPFYLGASLLCLGLGLRQDSRLLFLLSGVFLFLAFQARATSGVLIVPLVLIALWSSRRSLPALVLPAATFAALLVIFWVFLYFVSGDPLLQYRLLVTDATVEDYAGTGQFLAYFMHTVARINVRFGLLYHLAILALIIAVYRSRRAEEFRMPLIAFACLYLFFEFGSTSLTSYQPIWKIERFLTILTIPAALLIALSVDKILAANGRWPRRIAFGLVAMQVMLGIGYVLMFGSLTTRGVIARNSVYKRVIQQLGDNDGATVGVVHFRWSLRGNVYAAYEGVGYNFESLEGVLPESIPPGTIVIFDPIFFSPDGERTIDRNDFPSLEGLPDQPPEEWELLFSEKRVENDWRVYVYRVGAETGATLMETPAAVMMQ